MEADRLEEYDETDRWSIHARHDWDSDQTLDVTLRSVLTSIDVLDKDTVVYDYIDIDSVHAVMNPNPAARGAHELRFYCEGHEVQIAADGTIATRPSPE